MTTAKAALFAFVFLVSLMALGVVALYFISPIGFGVALGVIATAILGTFFMLAVAVANRIINGGGVRSRDVAPPPPPPPTWQLEPPVIDGTYHPVLGSTRPALPPGAMNNLQHADSGVITPWSR